MKIIDRYLTEKSGFVSYEDLVHWAPLSVLLAISIPLFYLKIINNITFVNSERPLPDRIGKKRNCVDITTHQHGKCFIFLKY